MSGAPDTGESLRREVGSEEGSPGVADGPEAPRAPVCDLCGSPMRESHCKLICDQCGYTRDCSDP